jgi:hypothetical protein
VYLFLTSSVSNCSIYNINAPGCRYVSSAIIILLQNTINSSEEIRGLMRDVIENGKSDEALSQIQKRDIRRYILNDARYFKETYA